MYVNIARILLVLLGYFTVHLSQAQDFQNLRLNSRITSVQPMTGIVFWSDNLEDLTTLGNKVQLEFSYLVYSDIINSKGVYNWSSVDRLLSQVANRGHQAILRFRYVYPGITRPSVPQYIRDQNDYRTQVLQVENQNTYIPDWSNAELKRFTKEFYTKFAERYDNDARLAFLQMGFGSYAEYHLYDGPKRLGQTFPSKAYQEEFLKHLNVVFKTTQWAISIDAASSEYTPIAANSQLRELNFGLFDDSFLHAEHSTSDKEYNRQSWLTFGKDRANTRVAGGELNYYSDFDQQNVLKPGTGPHGISYEELSAMYDISYMIGNDQLKYQPVTRIEEASKSNGYKYEVTAFKTNGISTEVVVKNNGIAPIYYDAYPTVNGIRSTQSLKGLAKGQRKTFIIETAGTDHSLRITSDRLVVGQVIEFDADLEANTLSSTSFEDMAKKLVLYPNPFQTGFMLQHPFNAATNVQIKVYDLAGRMMVRKTGLNNTAIDTTLWPTGSYMAVITIGNFKQTHKLIKV